MQITNIKELRESLSKNYQKMVDKELSITLGKELANTAGKIINSCRIELEYNSKKGLNKKIDFLETE